MSRRNIRLLIAFDGSNYSGWQRQKNAPTVQGTITDRLETMTGADVALHGAGRTDAGVHAMGMVANFETYAAIPASGFHSGLNAMLPKDIRILRVDQAGENFHSRYDATGKTYRYTLFTGMVQLPTERLYTAHYPGRFNAKEVKKAMTCLQGTHDFSSFEGSGSRDLSIQTGRGAVRTLFRADISPHEKKDETWIFTFTGDGFLRHMVRNLVGTLLEVGFEKLSSEDFRTVLLSRNRENAGPTSSACGLALEKVYYESLTSVA